MELKLKNIGKILEADVKLNGITVVAGENNTGKSTLGKVLFSVFSGLYDTKSRIELERKKEVRSVLIRSSMFDDEYKM